MLPTFSVNIDYNKDKKALNKIQKILIDINKNDETRAWAGEAFLKASGQSDGNLDLVKYAKKSHRNQILAEHKRFSKEKSLISQKEVDDGSVSYRKYGSEETITLSYEEFINMLNKEIDNKELL